jgi:hypothetical protein
LTGTSKFLNDLLFFIGEDLSISISDSFEMSLFSLFELYSNLWLHINELNL